MIKEKAKKMGKEQFKKPDKQKTNNKVVDLSQNILMFTLNLNGLNATIKRHRLPGYIKNASTKFLL